MKKMHIKSLSGIIALAIISILSIGTVQLFWFKKAFDLKDKQFNHSVTLSLQTVGEYILNYNQIEIPSENLVEQISSNYYVVHTNAEIDLKILELLIRGEFEKRNLEVDFEYGVYDCFDDKLIYGNYVSMEDNDISDDIIVSNRTLPRLENDNQYFGVYFPKKENELLSQMSIWLFSTIVLLLVFLFFAASIFILFRQKKLSEMQKDFINNMTHEFKTPLYTIMVTTELLKQPEISNNESISSNYLEIIKQEAHRLKIQIERILQFATSDKEKLGLQIEEVDIHESIKKACEAAATLLTAKNGSIQFSLQAEHPVIKGDKMHIENVIYNLIENALKYTDEPPVINISTYNNGKMLHVNVKDNGIGMEEKQIRKIFNKFYRIPTGNTHNVKGFGLGLAYVREIVKAHKGNVNVKSKINAGSTFELSLPYDQN